MARKTAPLLPAAARRLQQLGERLRLARLRRRLQAQQVAERAGMSRMTLRAVERGADGATMGAYLAVLQVLGLDEDLDLVARDDVTGRRIEDARLGARARPDERGAEAPRASGGGPRRARDARGRTKEPPTIPPAPADSALHLRDTESTEGRPADRRRREPLQADGVVSSEALASELFADLLDPEKGDSKP